MVNHLTRATAWAANWAGFFTHRTDVMLPVWHDLHGKVGLLHARVPGTRALAVFAVRATPDLTSLWLVALGVLSVVLVPARLTAPDFLGSCIPAMPRDLCLVACWSLVDQEGPGNILIPSPPTPALGPSRWS